MSLALRLGKASIIYTGATVLQRGVAFFLLPFYTRHLSPDDYGVLAVVTALNGVLAVAFTLALHGAATRFYFEYRDRPAVLRRFWGTLITFVLINATVFGCILLAAGPYLLRPVLGRINFWPYAALGIVASIFQPFMLILLNVLQTREQPLRYAAVSVAHFTLNLTLIIALVAGAGMRAEGPLAAAAVLGVVFFGVALFVLRRDFVWCLDRRHLVTALRYSVPLTPHLLFGQLQVVFDRFVLNHWLGAAAAGVYQVGYLFGGLVTIIAESVNRAFSPIATAVLSSRSQPDLERLRDIGSAMTIAFTLAAVAISIFSPELVAFFATGTYARASTVVPLIALGCAVSGTYYAFVNILFYTTHATRFVMLGTAASAGVSVVLNLLLVPRFGLVGAGTAFYCSQVACTAVIACVAVPFEVVRWRYAAMTSTIVLGSIAGIVLPLTVESASLGGVALKALALLALYFAFNYLHWGHPNHLGAALSAATLPGIAARLGRRTRAS